MRPIIIFIVLCVVKESIQKVEFYEEKTTPIDQTLCVKIAFGVYFEHHSNILLYSKNANNIINSLPQVPYFVATEWDSMRKMSVDAGAVIMFLEGNVEQDFGDLKRLRGFAMAQPVLIVCITDAVCGSEMYINEIVKSVDSLRLLYVAVDDGGIIDIYEYTTTAEGKCGVAQLLRRGRCSDQSTVEKIFQTPLNFHECPMRVITWSCPPYVEICDSEVSKHLCGIEGNIMQVVAEKVNVTAVTMTVESSKDVRSFVANRYADLGFGKLHAYYQKGISYSIPYLFSKATIVAPHATWSFKGSIRDILEPFAFEVWVGVGVVIIVTFILRKLVPSFRIIQSLQLFGILIGIPVPRQPRRLPTRIYFVTFMLVAYVCAQSYLANLTKVLTSPRQLMIKTLDDLENSDLIVTGSHAARQKFKDDYPRIYKDFQAHDYSEYNAKLDELLASRSSSPFYVEVTDEVVAEWKGLKAIQNEINWYPVAMVAPNSSAILRSINKILTALLENGFVNEYVALAMRRVRCVKYKKSASLESSNVLDLGELQGAFILLTVGLGISFLVFLVEIMTPFIKMKAGFTGGFKIHPKRLGERNVNGILLPRQTSRTSRY